MVRRTMLTDGNSAGRVTTLWRDGHARPLRRWLVPTPMEMTNVVSIQPCRGDGMPRPPSPGSTPTVVLKDRLEAMTSLFVGEGQALPVAGESHEVVVTNRPHSHGRVGAGSHACPPPVHSTFLSETPMLYSSG